MAFSKAGGAWLLFLEHAYQQIFGRWENFEMGRFCALFWRRLGSEVVENSARQHLFEQPSQFFFSYTCVGARPLGSDPAVLGVRQQGFYREFLKRSSPLRDPAHVFLRKAEEMIGRMALL